MARDRRDGKVVRDSDPMHKIMLHIMPKRCDSDVYINQKFDVTELVKYYEKKKKDDPELTYFHLFVTMIVKVFYNKPYLNRFIINKTMYERNKVQVAYTGKINYKDESKEVLSVIDFNKDDTLNEVKDKVLASVKKVRNTKEEVTGTNDVMEFVSKFPKFMVALIVKVVKFMDNHDLLPNSLREDNLYYSSVIVSNLGSIKGGAIYHHLTDFGTSSILATIGEIKKEKVIMPSGKEEVRDMCEFGINLDERIADGVYFIKAAKMMQDILLHPETLEDKVGEKLEDKVQLKY